MDVDVGIISELADAAGSVQAHVLRDRVVVDTGLGQPVELEAIEHAPVPTATELETAHLIVQLYMVAKFINIIAESTAPKSPAQ